MTSRKQKLELTWIGKENRPKLEPRILLEDPERSYHAARRVSEDDIFDNRLIFGDNLLALKALEQEFAGQVKCIYIDPPFNTGGAFEHYDDNLEHSLWLNMMYQRLTLLHRLLSPEGAIVVNLDDMECAYCKVMLDEIFGRSNYILTIVVEAATTSSFKTVNTGPTEVAQYLLFYAKDKTKFTYRQQYLHVQEVDLQHFSRFISNFDAPAEEWEFKSINDHVLQTLGYEEGSVQSRWNKIKRDMGHEEAKERVLELATAFALENCHRVFETKTLQKPSPWLRKHILTSKSVDHVVELKREGLESVYLYKGRQVYFLGKGVIQVNGQNVVSRPISNIWNDIPTNNLQKEGGVSFPAGKKPEDLLFRIINMISGSQGDIVLDSFAGSGTTGAVAHKMRRRWIMVELGDHCHTHIIPRMKKVIDGDDPGGITEAVHWKGGGGFRYYRLAPSLLQKDNFDNWVINKDYNAEMLAQAVCKLEGFTYAPSDTVFWQHGYSTETDFIYVTTQSLTREQLAQISDEVGENQSLLICCGAFRCKRDAFPNLTIKKIPKAVLKKCEYGHDDYSLEIRELPPPPDNGLEPPTRAQVRKQRREAEGQMTFGEESGS